MQTTRMKAQKMIADSGTKWSLGMNTALPYGIKCHPVPACDRGWRPGMNCNCTHPGTEKATSNCIKRLQSSVARSARPSVMQIPYLDPATSLSSVTCAGGVAAVGLLGSRPAVHPTPQPRDDTLELSCVPGTGTLLVEFASFGMPVVTPAGGRFIGCSAADCADLTPRGSTSFWESAAGVAYPVTENNDCTTCSALRGHGWPNTCTKVSVNGSYIRSLRISQKPFSCAVQQQCSAFARNVSCDAGPSVLQRVKQACDGRQSCRISLRDLPQPPLSCRAGADQPMKLAVRASGCRQGVAVAGFREKLASFLLTRGPHAWFGNGWIASKEPLWFDEFDVDYGEPLGQMQISGTVATRQWSKMNVSLDCSSYEANFNLIPVSPIL